MMANLQSRSYAFWFQGLVSLGVFREKRKDRQNCRRFLEKH